MAPIFNVGVCAFSGRTLASLNYVLELFYNGSFGLIIGIAISFLHDQVAQRFRFPGSRAATGSIALVLVAAALLLLIESFRIAPERARDQLSARCRRAGYP